MRRGWKGVGAEGCKVTGRLAKETVHHRSPAQGQGDPENPSSGPHGQWERKALCQQSEGRVEEPVCIARFQENVPLAEARIPEMLGFRPVVRFVHSRQWFAGDQEQDRKDSESIDPEIFKPKEFRRGALGALRIR